MISRTLVIDRGPARLFLRNRQIVFSLEGETEKSLPIEDIGVLVVDHPAIGYSHSLLSVLAEEGVVTVISGQNHHPAAIMLPFSSHSEVAARGRAQVDASLPLQKRLWQALIRVKISLQGEVLKELKNGDHGLGRLSRSVRSGDPDNCEAQAARRYWPALFGSEFFRNRSGPPPNNMLNYGYTILRAAVARAVVASGMIPQLGVFHRHRANAFCLADDLLEPFRPFVDRRVFLSIERNGLTDKLDRSQKQHILGALDEVVPFAGKRTTLQIAIRQSASSLASCFVENERHGLQLPEGLPVPGEPDLFEGETCGPASHGCP